MAPFSIFLIVVAWVLTLLIAAFTGVALSKWIYFRHREESAQDEGVRGRAQMNRRSAIAQFVTFGIAMVIFVPLLTSLLMKVGLEQSAERIRRESDFVPGTVYEITGEVLVNEKGVTDKYSVWLQGDGWWYPMPFRLEQKPPATPFMVTYDLDGGLQFVPVQSRELAAHD